MEKKYIISESELIDLLSSYYQLDYALNKYYIYLTKEECNVCEEKAKKEVRTYYIEIKGE